MYTVQVPLETVPVPDVVILFITNPFPELSKVVVKPPATPAAGPILRFNCPGVEVVPAQLIIIGHFPRLCVIVTLDVVFAIVHPLVVDVLATDDMFVPLYVITKLYNTAPLGPVGPTSPLEPLYPITPLPDDPVNPTDPAYPVPADPVNPVPLDLVYPLDPDDPQ